MNADLDAWLPVILDAAYKLAWRHRIDHDELVSNVFVNAWRSADKIKAAMNAESYLVKMCKNEASNLSRRRARKRSIEPLKVPIWKAADVATPEPQDDCEWKESAIEWMRSYIASNAHTSQGQLLAEFVSRGVMRATRRSSRIAIRRMAASMANAFGKPKECVRIGLRVGIPCANSDMVRRQSIRSGRLVRSRPRPPAIMEA